MKNPRVLILLGLILLIMGGMLAQHTVKGEEKRFYIENVHLLPANSTYTIDLGKLDVGSNIWVNFRSIYAQLSIQVQHAVTKENIPEFYNNVLVYIADAPFHSLTHRAHIDPNILWKVEETDNYVLVIGVDPNVQPPNATISFFDVLVVPPTSMPYMWVGVGILSLGIIVMASGIYLSYQQEKKARQLTG